MYVSMSMYVCMYLCTYARIYACIYARMHVCMYVCRSMYEKYVYIHICIYMYYTSLPVYGLPSTSPIPNKAQMRLPWGGPEASCPALGASPAAAYPKALL